MVGRSDVVVSLFDRERGYFEEAARGRVLLLECRACARMNGPFDYVCRCGSPELQARAAAGTGTVEALTEVFPRGRASEEAPFWVAWVRLDEGVPITARLAAHVVDPVIGDRVTATFLPCGEGLAVPEFVLAADVLP